MTLRNALSTDYVALQKFKLPVHFMMISGGNQLSNWPACVNDLHSEQSPSLINHDYIIVHLTFYDFEHVMHAGGVEQFEP